MRFRNVFVALLAGAGLAACAAGPDYVAPVPSAPAQHDFIGTARSEAVTAQSLEGDWWRLYDDPVLDRLVEDALSANTDVRVAVARIERARASLRGARSDRLPATTIGSSATYGRVPAAQSLPGIDRERRTVDGGVDISYELDLFGRVARGIEAATGDWQAAR
jgi:outer membrane protein, multidrug efflux system